MNEISLSAQDRTNSVTAGLTCERCFKSYQRRVFLRPVSTTSSLLILTLTYTGLLSPLLTILVLGDLLMRHRRRCQGPKKLMNRRKACDACVQAKARCCFTQPTCSRCAKRGLQCVYAAASAASISDHSEQRNEAADYPNLRLQSSSSGAVNSVFSSQLFEPELSAWDLSSSSYPLEAFDMTLADLPNIPSVTRLGFTGTEPPTHESLTFTPSSQALSESPGCMGIPGPTPLTPSSNESASSGPTPSSSSTVLTLVRALSKYPSLLTTRSFFSPFLHLSLYSLYSNIDPDMTFLPLTSMAICCGSGLNLSADKRFFRRAMDAARQRLIGSFVSAAEV